MSRRRGASAKAPLVEFVLTPTVVLQLVAQADFFSNNPAYIGLQRLAGETCQRYEEAVRTSGPGDQRKIITALMDEFVRTTLQLSRLENRAPLDALRQQISQQLGQEVECCVLRYNTKAARHQEVRW